MSEETKQLIINYVRREYLEEDSTQEVTAETKLISSGIVDSFSMVSLKMFLEWFDVQYHSMVWDLAVREPLVVEDWGEEEAEDDPR